MSRTSLTRLTSMHPEEAAFRLRAELRKWRERAGLAASRPRWNPARLVGEMLDVPAADAWNHARSALRRRQDRTAHEALAHYFSERSSAFPLDPKDLAARAATIAGAFPGATEDARRRADAVAAGYYDLLGYERVHVGRSIDWHRDAVHDRRAPMTHWASVPYLNPRCGDHKVIWELNRHQHWLVLGRAFALTGDPAYYDTFRAQLRGWMAVNPPLLGVNWASMLELALRTVSWLWGIGFFAAAARNEGQSDSPWLVDALLGIAEQLPHVERNLSLYFSPNTHLTGEALALYVAGYALPEFASSRRWTAAGREVLLREASRQVRPDGGHAELSGHYHRYSTDFYLLALAVAQRGGDPAAAAFDEAARRQARYLRAMADDAGRRPALGDDDGGQLFPICGRPAEDCRDTLAAAAVLLNEPELAIAPAPEETFWLCGQRATAVNLPAAPGVQRSIALSASGYYVSRTPRGDHLVFDAGPHGYLNGGHAHADALSVLLTIQGHPLLIDPGTATYTMDGDVRDRFRDSAMHNTLVLDGRPQSQPDGPFRWRSRTSAQARIWRSTGESSTGSSHGCDYVEGTHDGYLPVVHVRAVLALHGVGWWILDHLIGEGNHAAAIYWHVHPSWRPSMSIGAVRLRHDDGMELALASSADLVIVSAGEDPLATWSPVYGRVDPAPLLRARVHARLPYQIATFIPASAAVARRLAIERLTVVEAQVAPHTHGWRASWADGAVSILAALDGEVSGRPIQPMTRWGTRDLQTDGRLAAVVEGAGAAEAVLVNGRSIWRGGTEIVRLPARVEIARLSIDPRLASSMHEHASAEVVH